MKIKIILLVLISVLFVQNQFTESTKKRQFDESKLKIKWIKIPAGKYKMGSDIKNRWDNENPAHSVELDTYYISKYEITLGQFKEFIKDTNYITEVEKKGLAFVRKGGKWQKDKNANWKTPGFSQKDNHPVVLVSSGDAQMFCKWLSKKTGKKIFLPTEAQWEKAARGSDGRTYPWGNSKLSEDKLNCSDINIKIKGWGDKSINDGFAYTSPVGYYPAGASVYDVMDMAGNVWEWCRDLYQKDYYSKSEKVNPKGPKTGNGNTFRGGGWYCGPKTVTTTVRGGHGTDYSDFGLGFRIVLEKDIEVKDIIKKCAEAMGGVEKIKSLQTIRISVKYQGHKKINFHEIKRPNFYKTTNNINSNSMIFDSKRACFLRYKDGKKIKEMVKKKEMSDFVAEPGFSTFYFFDFPTEYKGIIKIENQKAYHLSVKMPYDVIMHYYIDCNTNLLKRTVADVNMNGKKVKWSRDYSNYIRVAGILYPHAFTWYHNISEKTRIPKKAVITRVEFNVNFRKDHFNILNNIK